MKDSDRLYAFVLRYFECMGRTEFPTVRRAQRTLRWGYKRIVQAIDDDANSRMFSTSHKASKEPSLGEHYIEVY